MEDRVSTPGYTQYGDRLPQAGPAQPYAAQYPGNPTGGPAYPGMQQVPPFTAPQGPVIQTANWLSIILGIVGWVLIGLTVLVMVLAIRASASDPDPTGKEVIGFFPLFALPFFGLVNLAGGVIGIMGAVGKPKTLKLNWLGILLNASPYVIFTVLPFLLAILFGR